MGISSGGEIQAAHSKSVLIVEDEALFSIYLNDLISDIGYQIVGAAASCQQAIDMAAGSPPDIALVDVSLSGGGDGIGLAAELSNTHGTAIVLLSGHANLEEWPGVKDVCPAAILQKPCLLAELEAGLQAAAQIIDARQG